MTLLRKIFSNSFWILVGISFSRVAMFITNIIAARILSQELFGQFTMIRNTMATIGNIVNGPLGRSTTKFVAESKHQKKEKIPYIFLAPFFLNLVIILIILVLLLFASGWLVDLFFLGLSSIKIGLYIGIFFLVGSSFSIVTQSILIGFEHFKKFAYLSIIISIISVPLIIPLIKYYKFYGALSGVALFFILDFIIKFIYLIKYVIKFDSWPHLNKLLSYSTNLISFSTPLIISIIINSGSFWYARVLIVNESNNFSDLAIFDAAYQWLTIIMLITGATTSVALPMLSNALGADNIKQVNRVFYFNLMINIFISSSLALIFILFSKSIMALYGTDYIKGGSILIILSLTTIMFSISGIYSNFMISHNKSWIVLLSSIFGMLAMFITLYYMIDKKEFGLAWSFFSYYTFNAIIYIITGIKYLRIKSTIN